MDVDVFAFGITTGFRTRLFPGSARMLGPADRTERLQVEALCWCGARATHNARTEGGIMVTEGSRWSSATPPSPAGAHVGRSGTRCCAGATTAAASRPRSPGPRA